MILKPEKIQPNQGTPGWLELYDLSLHRDMEAVAPHPPYVHGLRDQDGHFYPDEPYEIISE